MITYDNIIIPKGTHNTPDYIKFYLNAEKGKSLSFEDDNAYPLIIDEDEYIIHIGEEGSTHIDICDSIGHYLEDFPYTSLGRIWDLDELLIISMWEWDYDNAVSMVKDFIHYLGVNPKIIVGLYDNIKINLTNNIFGTTNNNYDNFIDNNNKQEIEKLRQLHLQKAQDKWDNTQNFRQFRDELQGKKLGNMTMAQYNALRRVDENKKQNIQKKSMKQKVKLTESQLRNIIKKVIKENWMDSQRHTFTDGTSILNGHGGSGAEGSLWNHNHKDIIDMANQLNRKCWDEALRLRDEYQNTDDEYFDENGNIKQQIQCLEELSHFLTSFTGQAENFID